jgi:hypothetical protein
MQIVRKEQKPCLELAITQCTLRGPLLNLLLDYAFRGAGLANKPLFLAIANNRWWLTGWCLHRTTLAPKWLQHSHASGGKTLILVGLKTGHVKNGSVVGVPLDALGLAFFAFSDQVSGLRMKLWMSILGVHACMPDGTTPNFEKISTPTCADIVAFTSISERVQAIV